MKKYREWLPANGYEATGSLGSSFVWDDIEDYYLTPYELGYGAFVKFDHDFIGRAALEKKATEPATQEGDLRLEWRRCSQGLRLAIRAGSEALQVIDLPLSNYASSSYDKVTKSGKTVGLSMFSGYSYNEQSMLSLGVVDPEFKVGDELTLVWGVESGGTKKTTVERHEQIEIRATVGPVPYGEAARVGYRPK